MVFCRNCGTEMKESMRFCPKCGTAVEGETRLAAEEDVSASGADAELRPDPSPIPQPGSQPESQPQPEPQSEPEPEPQRRRSRKVAVAIVAVIIVCVGVGIGVWWKFDQDAKQAAAAAQAEWERTHVTAVTRIDVEAPGFDDAATGIPVQIAGTDLDGNQVSETQYIHASNMEISTLPGTYEISFPGGYFAGDGSVVKAPATKLAVEVPSSANAESGTSASSGEAEPSSSADSSGSADDKATSGIVTGEKPVFTVVAPLDVTDELLTEIGDLAKADPQDGGKAESLQKAATEVHDQAAAEEQLRKEEEERAAREEAERQAVLAKINGWWTGSYGGSTYYYHIQDGTDTWYKDNRGTATRGNTKTFAAPERVSASDGYPSDGWLLPFTDAPGYYLGDDDPNTLIDMAQYSDSLRRGDPPAYVLSIAD